MTKKTTVKKPVKVEALKKPVAIKSESIKKVRYTVDLTQEAFNALNRIQAFNPGLSKKDVASSVVLEAVKQYKGKKPPKAKK